MARIAEKDKVSLTKYKSFLFYLIEYVGMSHLSIARAINSNNAISIREGHVSVTTVTKIIKAYYNNYKVWCNEHGLGIEQEFIEYNKKLYS